MKLSDDQPSANGGKCSPQPWAVSECEHPQCYLLATLPAGKVKSRPAGSSHLSAFLLEGEAAGGH